MDKIIVYEYLELIPGELISINNKYYAIHHIEGTYISKYVESCFYEFEHYYRGVMRLNNGLKEFYAECDNVGGYLLNKAINLNLNGIKYSSKVLDATDYVYSARNINKELYEHITKLILG